MKLPFCPYEEKVVELLRRDSGLESADPKLTAHLKTCSRCGDILLTSRIFKQGHSERMLQAHTGSPHFLWWKAQLRLRNSTIEKVTKPLALAEKLALACLLCIVAGIGYWQWQALGRWIDRISNSFETETLWNAPWFQAALGGSLIGYSALAGIAVVAGIGGMALLKARHRK